MGRCDENRIDLIGAVRPCPFVDRPCFLSWTFCVCSARQVNSSQPRSGFVPLPQNNGRVRVVAGSAVGVSAPACTNGRFGSIYIEDAWIDGFDGWDGMGYWC